MNAWDQISAYRAGLMNGETAITIGNFDGVHLGHAILIRRAREAVGPHGRVIVLAFDPHPSTVLQPDRPRIGHLTNLAQRAELLLELGADEVQPLQPTRDLLAMSPEDFLGMLNERYGRAVFVEGEDFRFGRGRAGDVHTLSRLAAQFGGRTIIVEPVHAHLSDHTIVRASSTMVRWQLERGRVRDASMILGRPYEIIGCVVRGERRGRTLGFPTMNLDHADYVLPADGIYAGQATLPDDAIYPAAISVGTKPTFGRHPRLCEAHLLDYHGPVDEYGWMLRLRFSDYLRDQLRYDDAGALTRQLHRDVARVRSAAPKDAPLEAAC